MSEEDRPCRKLRPAEAVEACELLREAARWSARHGVQTWRPDEFVVAELEAQARAGELFGAFQAGRLVATMRLQTSDDLHWPEDAPGSALYVHKVAVRRDVAGQGWTDTLLRHAAVQARTRGVAWLRLDTLDTPRLVALYQRLGFRLLEEPPRQVGERIIVRLERSLGIPPP